MAISVYKSDGSKATAPVTLNDAIFGVTPDNHDLLKNVYTAYLSNGRTRNAVTKTRGLVSGGGKKPWKQKGTGRARFGSSRNPIWRGGGIAFGPTGLENYTKNINVKAKRLAIRQALSLANDENKVIVIESLTSKEGKTSEFVGLLSRVGAVKKTLVIVDALTTELVRATSNLAQIKLIQAKYLNAYDAMNADTIVITQDGLTVLDNWLIAPAVDADQKDEA